MKSFIKPFENFIENTGRGLIYIDETGHVACYSMLARKITSIVGAGDMKHDAGKLEDGDIVVIADNELGNDDDMTPADLASIGVVNKRIKLGSAILAVGVYRTKEGTYPKPEYKYANDYNTNSSLIMNVDYLGHKIYAEVNFSERKLIIEVDRHSVSMEYFESIGHMMVLSGKTGEIKFFQALGYGYRKEEIGKLLRGHRFVAKITDGSSSQDGEQLVGRHYEDGIFDESFVEKIRSSLADVKDIIESGVFEIHQRPFYITFLRFRQWSVFDGIFIIITDPADFAHLVEVQGGLIKQVERFQRGKRFTTIPMDEAKNVEGLAGTTSSILEVKQLAYRASKGKFNVLITGESGTGKTRLAREIHDLSGTARPFVEVNCSAIPVNLFESELFGYVGGAFTGASEKGKKGYFEEANGGTIFLDEIGEIPTTLQAKLLQVLQTKKIYRVGSAKPIDVDVRVIASTNTNIKEAVTNGSFREDLYYRLDVFPIAVPALRERKGDIRELAELFLKQTCKEYGLELKRLSEDAYEKILSYDWPGNVRELENTIMRAVAICESSVIYEDYIYLDAPHARKGGDERSDQEAVRMGHGKSFLEETELPRTLKEMMEEYEKKSIMEAIKRSAGNKPLAMKELGLTRTSFYDKIKKYSID